MNMNSDTATAISSQRDNGICDIEEIIEDFQQGRIVIMVDDEDRENEGDLLIAAERIRASDINFMASHGRGLVCLTLTQERCEHLQLSLMVNDNNARYSTNFTVSIEAADGVTTGISAADRATTVLAAVHPDAQPADLLTPGHIFPVMAQPGGILTRAGHTEAGVDLARLAGFVPASVICEILNEDGSMARLPDLLEFGKKHGVKIGTIADLIRYRLAHEPTVHRIAESTLMTNYGEFRVVAYENIVDNSTHLALVKGQIDPAVPQLVRVHVFTGVLDMLSELRSDHPWSLDAALRAIDAAGSGVLTILQYHADDGEPLPVDDEVKMASSPVPTRDADEGISDLRMLGVGSQILSDLNVGKMRVLGTPRKVHGLSGFDLEIIDYISEPAVVRRVT